jgi:hypothetical protein
MVEKLSLKNSITAENLQETKIVYGWDRKVEDGN